MDATPSIVVSVLAAALLAALVGAAVAALVVRRRGAGPDAAAAQGQLQSSLDSLRLELRGTLDGATQTLNQRLAQSSTETDRRLAELGETVARRLSELGEGVGRRLETTSGMIGQRLEGAAKAVAEVHERLGTVQGATERILLVGQEIAELQKILRTPKLRGGLGETFLGELLAQVLPPAAYSLQHGFRSGDRVDAVVRLGGKLVPVDAKFPLENFSRMVKAEEDQVRLQARKAFISDVKKRIDEIAGKYILPAEGTFDFALMYVPAENVYYETIVRDQEEGGALYDYSLQKRVIPVSPNTFYSYLQVILFGLKGMQIDERAHEILRALRGLGGELDRFRAEFQTLGKHLEDALKKHGDGSKRLGKLQDSVGRLEALGEEEAADDSPAARAAEPGTDA